MIFYICPLTNILNTVGVLITNINLSEGFFPKESVVVYEKIGVIAPELIIKKLGISNVKVFENVMEKFIYFFA